MKIAIPEYSGDVCTVFDFAKCLIVIEIKGVDEINRRKISLKKSSFIEVAGKLKSLNVQILICGAISNSLNKIVSSYGIKIISQIRGTVDEVLNAYISGTLDSPEFFLPGHSPKSNSTKNNIISDR